MPSIEDVLGKINVPVRAVQVCLRGDLQAEHDELTVRLEHLRRESRNSLNQGGEQREVAERIRELEEEMRAAAVTFKFRGLGKNAIKRLEERFPPPDPNPNRVDWNVEEGAHALLAESAVEPKMNEEQAAALLEQVSQGHADQLVGAAWQASTGSIQIPFSVRASELIGGSGSN